MRLSEKTIELNICAQINALTKQQLIWFGLTQIQEARAGFDAFTNIGGKLLILQFKASNKTVKGFRRFYLNHSQMDNLRNRCKATKRSVYYVFPLVGSSLELAKNPDLIDQTWVLDVAKLAGISAPTTSRDQIRKSGNHLVDVEPGYATIHSEPVSIALEPIGLFVKSEFRESDGVQGLFNSDFHDFWGFRQTLLHNSACLVIPRGRDFQST